MAHATIRIETDNAAFGDFGDTPKDTGIELARILRALAARVESGVKGNYIQIKDINGNAVGDFRHEE